MQKAISILKQKCPKCNSGDVFLKRGNLLLFRAPKMRDDCAQCGHHFEIEPGYFIGAMYVSYGLVVAEMILIYILANLLFESTELVLATLLLSVSLLSFINFRYSRVIWMYIFGR